MYQFDYENHIHFLDGKPLIGTSTACGIINKPLSWWASGMAVGHLGWIYAKKKIGGKYHFHSMEERILHATPYLIRLKELDIKAYIKALDAAYKAHSDKTNSSADVGTERHADLEAYVKACIKEHEGRPYVLSGAMNREGEQPDDDTVREFSLWAVKNIKKFLWSEMHGYSRRLWTGGIADVGWLDMEDRVVAGDFKSSKEAYFVHFIQIAGYDIALSESGGLTAEGELVFELSKPAERYCVIPFGQDVLDPIFLDQIETKDGKPMRIEDFKKGFESAVFLHSLHKNYL